MASQNLNAKIELWKEIYAYTNKIEESYPLFYTLLITILGIVIKIFDGNLVPQKAFDEKFIVLIFLPIAVSAIIGYLAYNFRLVAITRMYAAAIEKEINREMDENIYVWNSIIVEEFMAKRNFANTKLLPGINILFFAFTDFFLNYSMMSSPLNIYFKIGYFIATTILFALCVCPFVTNEKIRKIIYKFKP